MSDGRSLGWCFTLNNYAEEDAAGLAKLEDTAQYIVYGKEVGEEGTPHLQGYVFFRTKKSLKQLKVFLQRAHWEVQKGTFEQAIDYCKKDSDFHEAGTPPMSKKRKGELGAEYWQEQLNLAKKGRISEVDPKLQLTHMSSLLKVMSHYSVVPADADDTTGIWYWGPTGTGKSRTARAENPGAYLKMCNKWWDGYKGEEVVIIEDFDKRHGEHLAHHLKIWADRYAFPAEVKGAKIDIRPKKIIVTSNYHPSDIWPNDQATLEPICRRFEITHFMNKLNQP